MNDTASLHHDDAPTTPGPPSPTGPLTVGLIGAGKLGGVIGQLAAEAGHRLLVAERPADPTFDLVLSALLPSAHVVPLPELLARADVVVLAVPQHTLTGLDLREAVGVVVDATNAWGEGAEGVGPAWWEARLPGVPVVKTLNHVAYTELLADARPAGAPGRRALAVAGDDDAAVALAAHLVDSLGYDAVPVPASAAGLLEPEGALFGGRFDADTMRAALGS
ncbi:NAD(P)-binding domain-containing protein [Micrococcus sp.]|uniref:NAD(P)-binding domain-containing protein n=1 Tax=Micrococcus sp. TaxID=1271 RepID=UPI002A90DFD5|nr:NAD(P)-binding domain-containing protein [Micrococcus sp.]MDY6054944.1 NAD(P)-binding domain-containing protein [Micrococcus sp.]